MTDATKSTSWLKWIVASVLPCTIIVFVVLRHPPASVSASLSVKEISFRTHSRKLLSSANQQQFMISRVGSISLQGTNVRLNTGTQHFIKTNQLELRGETSASCTFFNVRTDPIELTGDSSLTLLWPNHAGDSAFAIRSHGSTLSGSLEAQPSAQSKSGFICTRMLLNGEPMTSVEGEFSHEDSVHFTTASDTQLDFRAKADSDAGEGQIVVLDELRFSHVEPGQPEESVLLPLGLGQSYTILFEKTGKTVQVHDADLLVIRPSEDFYISKFSVNRGIHLALGGTVKDLRVGPGPGALSRKMPSEFDELGGEKPVFVAVVAIVSFIPIVVGALQSLGILKK